MMAWIEKWILPTATKIGNQRHLLSIRDAFVGMLAVTMVGSFGVLLNNIGTVKGFLWWGEFLTTDVGQVLSTMFSQLWFASLAVMTIYVIIGTAYKLARTYDDDGFEVMFVALASYLVLIPQIQEVMAPTSEEIFELGGNISITYLNGTALFAGIIIALVATEIFIRLTKKKSLVITMPDGVPPAVSRAFAKLFPGMITVSIFAAFGVIIYTIFGVDFIHGINELLVKPFTNAADTFLFVVMADFFVHFFWLFGLHGSNLLAGIITPLQNTLLAENIELYAAGVTDFSQYNVYAASFAQFTHMGGAGVTIGILIAYVVRGKRKEMVALGMPPALFNINEPVIFGLPIVLNPVYAIPFIVVPMLLAGISYIAINIGIVHPVVAMVPWVTPPIIGGWLATGGHISGAILSAVNLVIATAIYFPFVIMQERIDARAMEETKKKL